MPWAGMGQGPVPERSREQGNQDMGRREGEPCDSRWLRPRAITVIVTAIIPPMLLGCLGATLWAELVVS